MVRTFPKVYMELGSSFLFLQEQIKDIIIMMSAVNARSLLLLCVQTYDDVLFIGTRFSNLYTTVDTPA